MALCKKINATQAICEALFGHPIKGEKGKREWRLFFPDRGVSAILYGFPESPITATEFSVCANPQHAEEAGTTVGDLLNSPADAIKHKLACEIRKKQWEYENTMARIDEILSEMIGSIHEIVEVTKRTHE